MEDDLAPTDSIQIDEKYLKTPNAIIRLVEAALCIIGFICAVIVIFGVYSEGAFIQFATITGFLVGLAFFLINLFLPSFPGYKPIGDIVEMVVSVVYVSFLTIAGIIAAVNGSFHASIAATAAFSFFGAASYGVSTVLLFLDWRRSGKKLSFGRTSATPSTEEPKSTS